MLVSVIIPTYNRSQLLLSALQSVIAQTYRPLECIVVDDGSTDNTKELILELTKKNDTLFTLKYLYQQNSGSQIARNNGTQTASGEFIQYLDSDDLLYPDKLEKQVRYLMVHPECDAVFGDWEVGTKEKKECIIAYKKDNLVEQFLTERCIHTLSVLMRSSLVKKIGDWDIDIKRNQEIDFHLRGVLVGGKFEYQAGLGGLWRTHEEERIVNSYGFSSAIHFYKKWEEQLKVINRWNGKIQNGIVNNYIWFLNEYPKSNKEEMSKLLKEIRRLQPMHPVFQGKKFKICHKLFGLNTALYFWISAFKKTIYS